jgi:signal transduction histidine kinase
MVTVKSQLGEDGQIDISVNDTGPELPLGKADQFDAFFTTMPQGSGMDLAICKSSVESQGGRTRANSDGGRREVPLLLAYGSRGNKPSRECRVIRHSAR